MGFPVTARNSLLATRQVPATAPVSKRNPKSGTAALHSLLPEREKLLITHLPQVRLVAESIRERIGFTMCLDDLIGYGVIGLMKAVERFDPSRGILLKTYAEHRIRGAILDAVRGMDWLSRGARRKERLAQASRTQANPSWNGPSRHSDGTEASGNSEPRPPQDGNGVYGWIPRLGLINAGSGLEDLERLSERTGWRSFLEGSADTPETLYQRKEIQGKVAEAISGLPQRHRLILDLYYHKELSMKQIGEILNVHESRVSQLHRLALDRLRSSLSACQETDKPLRARTGANPV